MVSEAFLDEGVIIQVFATILVGVLIFLTVERRFEEKEYLSKRESLRTKTHEVSEEISGFENRLKILKNALSDKQKSKAEGTLTVTDDDVKSIQEQIHQAENLINVERREFESLIHSGDSLTRKYLQRYDQYLKIKSIEGFVTISMISLLLASIILMLLYPYPLYVYGSPISSWLFSAGLVFLLLRAILHGNDLEEKEKKNLLKLFKPALRKSASFRCVCSYIHLCDPYIVHWDDENN